jgi:acyl carrier protein
MTDQLNKIFSEVFEINPIPENFVKNESHLWDSLKHLTLIVEIETAFDISLSPEEITKIKSFSTALECVYKKTNKDEK